MSAIVWKEKDTAICVEHFHDRKRPALCIIKGTVMTLCGYFKDDASAELFMTELGNLVGATKAHKENDKVWKGSEYEKTI